MSTTQETSSKAGNDDQVHLCPRVAQRDAPFKENGSRLFIVACMVSAAPAELFSRQHQANDVTRITCEAAPHSTTCLLSSRCATRGIMQRRSNLSRGSLSMAAISSRRPGLTIGGRRDA